VTPDDIDRILAGDEDVLPSSGFEISVMEAVVKEATAPPPLEFPWLRALPGFIALLVVLAVAIWIGIGTLNDPSAGADLEEGLRALYGKRPEIGWAVLTAVMTIVSAVLPLRLIRRM
jgi:hypothetical protein